MSKPNWTDKLTAWSNFGTMISTVLIAIFSGLLVWIGYTGLGTVEDINKQLQNQTEEKNVNLIESIKFVSTITACIKLNGTDAKFDEWKNKNCKKLEKNEILYNKAINQSCSTEDGEYRLFSYIEKKSEKECISGFQRLDEI